MRLDHWSVWSIIFSWLCNWQLRKNTICCFWFQPHSMEGSGQVVCLPHARGYLLWDWCLIAIDSMYVLVVDCPFNLSVLCVFMSFILVSKVLFKIYCMSVILIDTSRAEIHLMPFHVSYWLEYILICQASECSFAYTLHLLSIWISLLDTGVRELNKIFFLYLKNFVRVYSPTNILFILF